ncbi:MAG: apolipoprotein N-acyltransferase [Bacteroidia bacterium]
MIPLKYKLVFLSVLSGLLLALAWPTYGFAPLLFVGFVPLLALEKIIFQNQNRYKNIHVFLYAYLAFIIWNVIATWWVVEASLIGGIMAMVCNTLLMSLVFMLFHITRKRTNEITGYFALVSYWISFEYIHLNWDLSWPWLTLGNGFSSYYKWIQWYEFTGVFGGGLWILIVNIFIFIIIKKIFFEKKNWQQQWKRIVFILALIAIPIVISLHRYNTYQETKNPVNVTMVQPNVDPYTEKFNGNFQEQVQKMLTLGKTKIDTNTDYLVFPETALTEDIWEREFQNSFSISAIKIFLRNYPHLKIVIGATTNRAYNKGDTISATARKFTDSDQYYDSYNTALQLDNSASIQVYHKSKLVPGVEKMPFPALMKPFEKLAINLGGTTGSLGVQNERSVFYARDKKAIVAPVICYESIYGEFVGGYILKGANLIFIITNDGWWGNTQGYQQHKTYASLRAIETRRDIARCANTGTSCFLNQRGDISQATDWWQPAVIQGVVNTNSVITFYSEHGDYIAHLLMYCAAILVLFTVFGKLFWKKKIE